MGWLFNSPQGKTTEIMIKTRITSKTSKVLHVAVRTGGIEDEGLLADAALAGADEFH